MAYYHYGFPPYVPVAEKRAKAEKSAKKLKKQNPGLKPVVIDGNKIAKTWWGIEWIKNLERYADYSNRIGRGRSYVRHGAVLDLQIGPGVINALVQGTQSTPYEITITIKPLSRDMWKKIILACEGKLGSLAEFLEGAFPKSLQEIFTVKEKGLFPSPKQISFDCSCPDWASMCKHIAAVLYGVGARFDEDPSLFFLLRDVKIDDLISRAVSGKSEKLLDKKEVASKRIMRDADISGVFGIDYVSDEQGGRKNSGEKSSRKIKPGKKGPALQKVKTTKKVKMKEKVKAKKRVKA